MANRNQLQQLYVRVYKDRLRHRTIVNAKIESNEFGQTKCFNIHIGNKKTCCEGLKVHDENIVKKDHETYRRILIIRILKTDQIVVLLVRSYPHSA